MDSMATRARRVGSALLALTAATVGLACLPVATQAAEIVKGKIAFVPYKLGAATTIATETDIGTTNGEVPSPAVKFELRFPKSLNLTSSNLGLAICHPAILFDEGQAACPVEARMGFGTTQVAVPFGPEVISESAAVGIYMGPPEGEATTVLLFGESHSPVFAQILMEGQLLSGAGAFNELALKTNIPVVPTAPGARDVAVTHMRLSLGPQGLTYHKRVRGRLVGYQPKGMILPAKCPAGGFPFGATMYFQDGTVVKQNLDVPCPSAHRRGHHKA
jgi:hypothetical protein